jgi:hypothetical protein
MFVLFVEFLRAAVQKRSHEKRFGNAITAVLIVIGGLFS